MGHIQIAGFLVHGRRGACLLDVAVVYTITGYAVNKRRLKLEKYHRLKIRVLSCGKTAFSKTWKDLSVNAGASSSKRLVLKAKGKAGLDLHANCAYNAYWEPIW